MLYQKLTNYKILLISHCKIKRNKKETQNWCKRICAETLNLKAKCEEVRAKCFEEQ